MPLSDVIARLRRSGSKTTLTLPALAPTRVPAPLYYELNDLPQHVLHMTPAQLWKTQPYLRTVVSFMARNIAQLALHTYRRLSDTDRERLTTHPLALLLKQPNPETTMYELVYQLVADLALYDRAYWYLSDDAESASRYRITRLPPSWVTATADGDLFTVGTFKVTPVVPHAFNQDSVNIPASQVLYYHGWNPDDPRLGCTPIDALKQILAEQIHAAEYRDQLWRRGPRMGGVLTRPADAPAWSDDAKERFKKEWRQQWSGDHGTDAGSTPILEDGMTLTRSRFSAHEEEFVESAKLALNVVASVYHINPTMIGLLDDANYSNVREFRRMLYGDTLGPVLVQIQDRVNTFLVPRMPDSADVYVEFNIEQKLAGSFEEQATAFQTAVGRPWMTADEARGRMNMPGLGGNAAKLVTPLNVLLGGQASPTDSGSQNIRPGSPPQERSRGVQLKERAPDPYVDKYVEVLRGFFARQERDVRSRLGAKQGGDEWWQAERWDSELADDLYALAVATSSAVAASTLSRMGYPADAYDVDRTLAYLRKISETGAVNLNGITHAQLREALDADDVSEALGAVWDRANNARAPEFAASSVTAMSGFGSVEAVKQTGDERAVKTWLTGDNPRPSHAALDGETVPIGESFSNGLMWPGDGGDPDEVAGCNCGVEIYVP